MAMIIAMVSVPTVDGIAKYLSTDYSPFFIGWARYAVAGLAVLPLSALLHGRRMFPSEHLASHIARTVFLVAAMTLYFLAIARIPLATALCAYFVGPILAVALSIVVLKERMTPAKGVSLALGFVGSLIILQPGGGIEPGILLALASGICFAFYLIATRRAAQQSDPVKTLAFQCFFGAALLTPQAVLSWSAPAVDHLLLFAGLGLISAVCHLLSIIAFRLADASTLAPLVYAELVGAAIVGYFAFGDVPDAITLLGAAFIISAGLILLLRRTAA
ncbi:DMT family transporter [Labrys sp. (in: a-proteobacteria)]|uniref:DMT family transporter n=1 Tax=Labrys sp. (in: a-proteobacteria) TaxID=1917972 RepID=UPI0039E2FF36